MSKVYIEGMEMPKGCWWCDFFVKSKNPKHYICFFSGKMPEEWEEISKKRLYGCPLR